MRKLLVLAAAVAAGVAVRRSVRPQEAERDSWAEATDGPAPTGVSTPPTVTVPADTSPPTT